MYATSILQWNLQGYQTQRPYLQHLIDKTKPQILCLQETHLKPKNPLYIPGYQYPPLRKDRADHRGGGVAIVTRIGVPNIPVDLNTDLEATVTKI